MRQILIIEDNKINCMIYEKILSDDKTLLDFAYDGQEGVDKFGAKKYDVILLDLGLPKISGLRVAQIIREGEQINKTVKTPIIVITADSTPETRAGVMEVGVDEYLTKPFNIDQLKMLVDLYVKKDRSNVQVDTKTK
jgi:two-component system response regulator ArlR